MKKLGLYILAGMISIMGATPVVAHEFTYEISGNVIDGLMISTTDHIEDEILTECGLTQEDIIGLTPEGMWVLNKNLTELIEDKPGKEEAMYRKNQAQMDLDHAKRYRPLTEEEKANGWVMTNGVVMSYEECYGGEAPEVKQGNDIKDGLEKGIGFATITANVPNRFHGPAYIEVYNKDTLELNSYVLLEQDNWTDTIKMHDGRYVIEEGYLEGDRAFRFVIGNTAHFTVNAGQPTAVSVDFADTMPELAESYEAKVLEETVVDTEPKTDENIVIADKEKIKENKKEFNDLSIFAKIKQNNPNKYFVFNMILILLCIGVPCGVGYKIYKRIKEDTDDE